MQISPYIIKVIIDLYIIYLVQRGNGAGVRQGEGFVFGGGGS